MAYKPVDKYKLKLEEIALDDDVNQNKVCCPNCNNPTDIEDVNIHDKIAKCKPCELVFPFTVNDLGIKKELEKEVFSKPVGIDVFEFKDELEIQMDSNKFLVISFSIFLALVALIISMGWIVSGFHSVLFVLMILMWGLTAYFINRYKGFKTHTVLSVDKDSLSILTRPSLFSKDKVYPRYQVEQIYMMPYNAGTGNIYTHGYLMARINTIDGQIEKNILGYKFIKRANGKYIEQKLEEYLQIENKKIKGEIE